MSFLGELYKEVEAKTGPLDDTLRQVWHTPTELFRVSSMQLMLTAFVSPKSTQ